MNPDYKVSRTPVMIQGHICDSVNLHRLPADSEAVDNPLPHTNLPSSLSTAGWGKGDNPRHSLIRSFQLQKSGTTVPSKMSPHNWRTVTNPNPQGAPEEGTSKSLCFHTCCFRAEIYIFEMNEEPVPQTVPPPAPQSEGGFSFPTIQILGEPLCIASVDPVSILGLH